MIFFANCNRVLQSSFTKLKYFKCMSNDSTILDMIKAKSTDINQIIDPKVKNIMNKLIYCDYIERKKLKIGYKKKKIIKNKLHHRFQKEILNNVISTTSIAVKYINTHLNTNNKLQHIANTMDIDNFDSYQNIASFKNKNKPMQKSSKNSKTFNRDILKSSNKNLMDFDEKKLNNSKLGFDNLSNIPLSWMTDYEIYNDNLQNNFIHGTSNPNNKFSSVPCGGCGALLHCKDVTIPGYLPSELLMQKSNSDLKSITCQRCHFIKYYNTCLDVQISANNYPQLIKQLRINKRAAVILLIDLTDFPCSIWPQLPLLIGEDRHVFAIGNKIDLLPKDSPYFLEHVKDCLKECVIKTGISSINIKYIGLISAKTGFGIEELISNLNNTWQYKGDVYILGCTNSGKSTLFNTLINSDFCKSQAVDLIQPATTSFWPGTTINVLKFPILKLNSQRIYDRVKRLLKKKQIDSIEEYTRQQEFKKTKRIELTTPQSYITHTFKKKNEMTKIVKQLNTTDIPLINSVKKTGINEMSDEYKHGHWCYDTPGTIHPDQILDLLTSDELKKTLPNTMISPRTFCVWPHQTIFLAGLGRLDILKASHFIRCTVFASNQLPITICKIEDAEIVYNELIQTEVFTVPIRNLDRLKTWPDLKFKDFKVIGVGQFESASDIVLSNAGWIAITGYNDDVIYVRAWTPLGRGIHLRIPSLLPKSVNLRGIRRVGSPAYRIGQQVYIK